MMRLTIVDRQMHHAVEVFEADFGPTFFSDFGDWLAQYQSADWIWFISPVGQMPQHYQHNHMGTPIHATVIA